MNANVDNLNKKLLRAINSSRFEKESRGRHSSNEGGSERVEERFQRAQERSGESPEAKTAKTGRVDRITSTRNAQKRTKRKMLKTRSVKLDKDVLQKNKILSGGDSSRGGMAYKILRTKVYKKLNEKNWTSVAVTSPNPSDGKTTTSINLALTLSKSVKNRILLVDLDLHRPNVHKTLGMAPEYGVSDYLQGSVSLSNIIYRVDATNLYVLPGRVSDDDVDCSGLLLSDRMRRMHRTISQLFDPCYIIYDMPPILAIDDVVTFQNKDCSLVVVAEGETTIDDLHHARELMTGQEIIGYVLNKSKNKVKHSSSGYYYNRYGYGYGYNYGNDYGKDK